MKQFNKNAIASIIVASAMLVASGFTGSSVVFAATTPSLGAAATYGVLSSTFTNTNPTIINGDVGFTTGPGAPGDIAGHPSVTYPNYGSGAPYATAGVDQGTTLTSLAAQPCTFSYAPGAIDLATDPTYGIANGVPTGTFKPGVICTTTAAGAMSIGAAGITLSGAGTYIFRTSGPSNALTTVVGSSVTLIGGASACDVFWTPTAATTLAATTTFAGTVIDAAGITVGASTTWLGRALAFGGTVITSTDTITVPTCAAGSVQGGTVSATVSVVKIVINDNGGSKTIEQFPLFVNGTSVTSGGTFNFPAGSYTVTETGNAGYTQTFSGDCNASGQLVLGAGEGRICIITNNDIAPAAVPAPIVPPVPPLIDVVKVPSPLALPAGPGSVMYTYTLRNVGIVPVTNITMVGDTCSPIVLVSGDTNGNNILEVTETWVHTCSTTLAATHTNTVVATGQANGLTATDIASATVIVGLPIVPPLIHVTKIPNPLALRSGGGMVTYTEKITNPGTVALSNVTLTDDKCSPLVAISGDDNGNAMLESTETWVYTCRTNLTQTTTNTAVATGQANGLTVRDFAIAIVVVPPPVVVPVVPLLPQTGFAPIQIVGVPMRIKIPSIKVNAAIKKVSLAKDGSMDVPKTPIETSWYGLGPRPGETGSAAIAGHVNGDYGRPNAVFTNLRKVKKGDTITVQDDKGANTSFVVRESKKYDATADATTVFNSSDGKAHLNLITCDGVWNKHTQQYSQRLVVFADKVI